MDVMSTAAVFAASPLPWVVLGGAFTGAAVSRLSRRKRPGRDPDRERSRKWIGVCLLLSIAVILGLAAVFLPGAARIVDTRLAWAAGASALIVFAALRFRKAAGIPVLVLVAAFAVVLGLFLQSLRSFTGETQIATVRVISAGGSSMNLELVPRGGQTVQLAMKGVSFATIVRVVIFDDFLVFLGGRTWYRFEGMTSFDANLRQQDTDYRLPRATGIAEGVWAFIEANEARIPGVKTAQVEMTIKKARDLASFDVMVQNDGGVEIVPRSG